MVWSDNDVPNRSLYVESQIAVRKQRRKVGIDIQREMNEYDATALVHSYLACLALFTATVVGIVLFIHDPFGVPAHGDTVWKYAVVIAITVWFIGHFVEALRCRRQAFSVWAERTQ